MASNNALMSIDDFSMFVEGLDHPECATRGPDGLIYAGGEAGQIYRVTLDGKYEQIATTGGFVLGLCLDASRNVYACDIERNAVMRITPDGKVSTYSTGTAQRKMVNPNYPAFDAAGNLYVTASGNWKKHDGCIYRIRPGGETEIVSAAATRFPNGCCLSPDGHSLFVVQSLMPGVVKLAIGRDGALSEPQEMVDLPGTVPDGVAFDVSGNLYISCYTPDIIYRLSPSADLAVLAQDNLRVTFASPTNIAFCGEDRRTLVVANLARWHLSKAQMPVAGLPLNYPQI
jgi:gluconolactonase